MNYNKKNSDIVNICDNTCNGCNNSCNSSINNDYLFFKVFRNVFLKKRIFNITRLYKNHHNKTFGEREKLLNFEFRNYILSLAINFEDKLEVGDIPQSVEHLVFAFYCLKKIKYRVLPSSLKSIKFGNFYNHSISGILPPSLTSICFGLHFRQEIFPGDLPSSLTSLNLKRTFFCFSLSDGVLPSNLRELRLGDSFNNPFLVGDLPESLTLLEFGSEWNQKLDLNVLPSKLKYLTLGSGYKKQFIKNAIPSSVKVLRIDSSFGEKLKVGDIPIGVEELVIPGVSEPLECGVIPETVTILEFSQYYNQPIQSAGVIPKSVKTLKFGSSFKQPLKDILSSLESLTSMVIENENYDQDLKESDFPSSLTSLAIHFPFDEYKHSIPSTIKQFSILGEIIDDRFQELFN